MCFIRALRLTLVVVLISLRSKGKLSRAKSQK